MPPTVLYMTVSLDGFVAGPNESWEDNPLGDDGGHLHGWLPAGVIPGERSSGEPAEDVNRQIGLGPEPIELDRVRVLEGERGVTHLRYRVRRPRGA